VPVPAVCGEGWLVSNGGDAQGMSERAIRLIKMAEYIRKNPGAKARELAELFEVSERTVYRDLEVLSIAIPLLKNDGWGTGYRVLEQ